MTTAPDVSLMPRVMRKVRGDAKLESLPLEQQATLQLWLGASWPMCLNR